MTKSEKKPPRVPDEDARLDEALEQSFPASDPIATISTTAGSAGAEPAAEEPRAAKSRPRRGREGKRSGEGKR